MAETAVFRVFFSTYDNEWCDWNRRKFNQSSALILFKLFVVVHGNSNHIRINYVKLVLLLVINRKL